MPYYAYFNQSDGQLLTVLTHILDAGIVKESKVGVMVYMDMPEGRWNYLERDFDPWAKPSKVYGKLDFRRLFTQEERMAFDNFEESALPEEYKKILRTISTDFALADEIDLYHPDTKLGVTTLEQVGILGPGRAAQVLAGDSAPAEEAANLAAGNIAASLPSSSM